MTACSVRDGMAYPIMLRVCTAVARTIFRRRWACLAEMLSPKGRQKTEHDEVIGAETGHHTGCRIRTRILARRAASTDRLDPREALAALSSRLGLPEQPSVLQNEVMGYSSGSYRCPKMIDVGTSGVMGRRGYCRTCGSLVLAPLAYRMVARCDHCGMPWRFDRTESSRS